MSWWRTADSYGVFFNRDERKTRQRADPPFQWPGGFLAPLDPESRGTWLAVNRSGLILALLNRWHEGGNGCRSRGHLIPELASCRNTGEVSDKLDSHDVLDYSPFTLLAMDSESILKWDWDSLKLTSETASAPITSSSFRFPEVRARREQVYTDMVGDQPLPSQLADYHAESDADAFSIRMLRDDAQTWSRSRIEVLPEEARWEYLEEFPEHLTQPVSHPSSIDLSDPI